MAKAVRLADIAKILNVSTVTVSKALSDQKGVSEEMRDKIKQLAEEMGCLHLKQGGRRNIKATISESLFLTDILTSMNPFTGKCTAQ